MAERNNPYSLRVELNEEMNTVDVTVRLKDENENIEEVDSRSFAADSIHESLTKKTLLYGVSKLLQDRSSDVKAGVDKLDAMGEVHDQLGAGTWEKARVVGAPVVSAEVEALAEIKGISISDAQRALKRYDKEGRATILASDVIIAKAAEIREARKTVETTDLDDLLA